MASNTNSNNTTAASTSNTSKTTNNVNNYQYASTATSVSSILNLPQVQDKKKPVGAAGLAKKPVGALGLAAPSVSTSKGTLKLLPKTAPKGQSVEGVSTLVNAMNIKDSEQPKCEPEPVAKVSPVSDKGNPKVETTVVKAKVEKPKSQTHSTTLSHSKVSQTNKKSTQTTTQIQPQDQFDSAHWRLFVGNLGPEVTDSILLSTFQNPYPSCSKALIVRDWKSQKTKGYGFVAFADGKEFLRALKEMQGKWIGNRQCIIKKSEHQPKFN